MTGARASLIVRLVVDDDECPYTVWAIHHVPTDLRVRCFFDFGEASRVMGRLAHPTWSSRFAVGNAVLLGELNRACNAERLLRRQILAEDTGELIVWCYGSAEIMRAVSTAERANA